jgi:uncharacterized protein
MARAAALLTALLVAWNASALEVPPPGARVTDLAGLLSPAAARALEQQLAAYEQRTGHQFAVLVVASLEGDPLEDFSMRVAEAWKLGGAERDDGLLLVIAVAERRARIEVGHGLEGAVTDALAARVIRGTLAPALAAGLPDDGVREALETLMRAAEEESARRDRPSRVPLGLFALFWIGLAVLALLVERARLQGLEGHARDGRRRRRRHVWIEPAGWGGGLGGFRPPGSFGTRGGPGGGFRGGGGSFGGGGASGGW